MEGIDNYSEIAVIVQRILQGGKNDRSAECIATNLNLDAQEINRLVRDWAGVSAEKFVQLLSPEYIKNLLQNQAATLFEPAQERGFIAKGFRHLLYVQIQRMVPEEYENGCATLIIEYSFGKSPFGDILVASTSSGIVYLAFCDDRNKAVADLQSRFPCAGYRLMHNQMHKNALTLFTLKERLPLIKLHLKGTDFQIAVWEILLGIPAGSVVTYGMIAEKLHRPGSSRAVGSAIGSNPVAFLVPCHRVIRSTGVVGPYMWGTTRKSCILGWEGAKVFRENNF